ncbi:MAG: glycosyltransferase family 9 protein [Verrucomicrobia bacterium]|nr:glycosyltransferase family 9 protein [Verrucomicrobiota bacterium]
MRLVLCRPDRVGDVILATACFEPIRQQLPDARLFFVAREPMRPLLENHPLLDGFLACPADASRLASFTAALRALRADAIVHLHPDRLCERAGADAQIPRRIGYRPRAAWFSSERRQLLTESLPDRRRTGLRHEAEYNFDLLAPLGVRPPASVAELRPRVALSDHGQDSSIFQKITAARPYVVLNPTAHSPTLRWPAARFAELATRIFDHWPDLHLVLVAERADDPSIIEIRQRLRPLPSRLLDLAGQTNLAELATVLHSACALVSRNTGTTHLAAAVGCPLVELFGRLEPIYGPGRWRALGPPDHTIAISARPGRRRWFESKRAFWQRGLPMIPTGEVFTALAALLSRKTAPPPSA